MADVLVLPTAEVPPDLLGQARQLMDVAFGDDPEEAFGDDDWQHGLGGTHVLVVEDGLLLAHASLVERTLHAGDRALRTGYVEAVATRPDRQGEGLGSRAVSPVTDLIRERFDLGALGTGRHSFYERLGWERWQGPTFVRTAAGELCRTEEDDDGVMVLRTGASSDLDLTGPLACEERPGDDW
jgi:aminoglycoside 2'-N-acetyltransferase I